MTEQEKREKAIAKMIKDSDFDGTFEFVTEEQFADIVRKGGYRDFARVYDAGYRKADEVRKETAKEIADWLDNNVYRIKEFREFIKRRFGVEVKE